MPDFIRKRLGERLVEEGLITEEQFKAALERHKETKVLLRQVLVDMGFISEDKLMEFMGFTLGVPYMPELVGAITDPQIVKLLPEKTCLQYIVMPLFKAGNILTVAMSDPFDVFAVDDLQSIAQCTIEPVLAKKENISRAIQLFYEARGGLDDLAKGAAQEAEALEIVSDEAQNDDDEVVDAEDAPIIKLVDAILTQGIKERASDIHIEPEEDKLRIRYRVDGMLREAMVPPKRLQAPIISRIKIMSGMDISIKRTPQDGHLKIKVEDKDIDVRISTVPTTYGEKVVLRLLDQADFHMGLGESGFDPDTYKQFEELIERPYGIILVTGPTGSGKTTSLYLALQSLNSPERNIITIEDPVEYELGGISQISVNVKAGVTFAKGLKSILRQDPDVIMVGEIRDVETADIAVRAALTGHLVFSTLHTNDAASSVVRMVDMGLPLYLVSSSICGVLAQRLVRSICQECKEPYQPSADILAEMKLVGAPQDYTFYRGKGCSRCGKTGYQGRTGIFELMVVDKNLRTLIHAGKTTDEIREAACKNGMKLLWEDGLDKVKQGLTTLEEVHRVTFAEQE